MGVGGELSRHPDYLLSAITSDQWGDWLAFHRMFPSPQFRSDINTALVRYSVMAPHAKGKIKLLDLLPKYGERKKRKTTAEMKEAMRSWSDAENARVRNSKRG